MSLLCSVWRSDSILLAVFPSCNSFYTWVSQTFEQETLDCCSEIFVVQQPENRQKNSQSEKARTQADSVGGSEVKGNQSEGKSHLKRGACPLLLANEKKPLCGEKSAQLTRWAIFFLEMGKLEKTVRLGRWTWGQERVWSVRSLMTSAWCQHQPLTRRTASSSARDAMARISDDGLKVSVVADVSRFITAFRGLGLAEFRHASWE